MLVGARPFLLGSTAVPIDRMQREPDPVALAFGVTLPTPWGAMENSPDASGRTTGGSPPPGRAGSADRQNPGVGHADPGTEGGQGNQRRWRRTRPPRRCRPTRRPSHRHGGGHPLPLVRGPTGSRGLPATVASTARALPCTTAGSSGVGAMAGAGPSGVSACSPTRNWCSGSWAGVHRSKSTAGSSAGRPRP